jgi:hypothetical protein
LASRSPRIAAHAAFAGCASSTSLRRIRWVPLRRLGLLPVFRNTIFDRAHRAPSRG